MSQYQVNVRKASKKDLKAIHQLVYELAVYEKAGDEFVASLQDYEDNFEQNAFFALVAELEDNIVGMAIYYPAYSTWKGPMMYLEDFVVKGEYRRHGIGDQLFEAFLEDARERGCTMVKWQVLDWNEPALRFYEKKKAVIEKEWWNGKILFRNK